MIFFNFLIDFTIIHPHLQPIIPLDVFFLQTYFFQRVLYLLKMADKAPVLCREQLLVLVRNRKYKEFATYIREIENMNEAAEESLAGVLESLLVLKTEQNPTVMLSALVLYKTLLLSACFDFSFSEECFPQRVHEEVARVCEYRPQVQAFSSRGSDYFVELFKVAKTEQNREVLERSGNSYVLMALQLVQAMATWYPEDYFDKGKSFFRRAYEQLLAKKVTFPKSDQLFIIKKNDEENFRANYQRFRKRMEADQSPKKEPQKEEKKQPPPPAPKKQDLAPRDPLKSVTVLKKAPGNVMNIQLSSAPAVQHSHDMIIIAGEVKSSLVSKPQGKNDPSMIHLKEEDILVTNNLPGSGQLHPMLSQNSQNEVKPPAKESVVPMHARAEEAKEKQKREEKEKEKEKEKREVFERSDSEDSLSLPQQSRKVPAKQKPTEASNVKPKASEVEPKPPKEIGEKPQPPPAALEKQEAPVSSARKQERQPKEERAKEAAIAEPVVREGLSLRSGPRLGEYAPNASVKAGEEMESPFSFARKEKEFGLTIRKETPRKIAKMEKPGSGVASLQGSPARPSPAQPGLLLSTRPRSLPKTEKRGTALNFFHPAKALLSGPLEPVGGGSREFNKTLSYWAHNRPRNLPSKLEKSGSLEAALGELRLDVRRLPFIAKYFEPATASMQALRAEALTLLNCGSSGNQFFASAQVECRLVKESGCVFTLVLQNVSAAPLLVEYCEMKGVRHSNRIKILSWGNRPEIAAYKLPRKGFMDIRFRFSVADLNFKFLSFLLALDGRPETLLLPVTLLDMCDLASPVAASGLHRYALRGSILASEPFVLGERGLPSFLGGFRFSPLSLSERGQVVGECSARLEGGDDEEGALEVVVRVADWQARLVELHLLHAKDQFSEDLAKVLLYLLVFLLAAE